MSSTKEEEIPFGHLFFSTLSYLILFSITSIKASLSFFCRPHWKAAKDKQEGYVPLYKNCENLYAVSIFNRIKSWWYQPIESTPGVQLDVTINEMKETVWNFRLQRPTKRVINISSYNYLGFAENTGQAVDLIQDGIQANGVGLCSTRHEFGNHEIHSKLERLMAEFLGVDDSIVLGMGFATNTTNIPALISKDTLVLSDEYNHASIILGCKLSGATICVFKHNDMKDLETKLMNGLTYGKPKIRRPWTKAMIIVEGIYSMHGTIVNLPELIRLKKMYKAYLYVDEAHSIGAIGATGKGVCEYYGSNPKDVDILMGTFTKSFGAAGGYVAGHREIITHLRIRCQSFSYATSMAVPIAQKVISVLETMMYDKDEATRRLSLLSRNTSYFRRKLVEMGFDVQGDPNSPVVLILLYYPAKMAAFVPSARQRGIGAVGVGFPAVGLSKERIRFCISSAHNKETLDQVLTVVNDLGDKFRLKYKKKPSMNPDLIQY